TIRDAAGILFLAEKIEADDIVAATGEKALACLEEMLVHMPCQAVTENHRLARRFRREIEPAINGKAVSGRQGEGLLRHPTLPSSETATNFCASTANSMGRCCKTSRQNPLTISVSASSSGMPRWRQ